MHRNSPAHLSPNIRLLFCVLITSIMMIGSLMAKPQAIFIPLNNNKTISVPMLKSFDAHLRSELKKLVDLIDPESTRSVLKVAGCGDQCKTLKQALIISKKSQVRFVFITNIENVDEIFQLQIKLLDGTYKKAYQTKKKSCEFCDEGEVKNKLSEMLQIPTFNQALKKAPPITKKAVAFPIKITSSPIGADIYVSQEKIGQTPAELSLEKGEYALEIRKKGYQTAKRLFKTPKKPPKKPITESFTLKPIAPKDFLVSIKSTPDKATCYLDGVKLKKTTPTKIKVKAGEHTIRIELKGYQEYKTTFKTPATPEEIKIEPTLKKKTEGTSTSVSTPSKQPQTLPTPSSTILLPYKRPALLNSALSATFLSLGLISAAAGGWLIFLHGDVTCTDGRERTACPNLYDTRLGGVLAFGAGMGMVGIGVASTILNTRWPKSKKGRTPSSAPVIAPTLGGATVQWGFEF